MDFKLAKPENIDEIHKLISSATNTMIKQNIYQWDEVYPNRKIIEEDVNNQQLYYSTIDDEIAVIFTLNKECDEGYNNGEWQYSDNNFCVIHRLCVKPEFQNIGLAKKAMSFIENKAKEMDVTSIRLDAFSENPAALGLYDGLGYKVAGYAYWRKGKFLLMEKLI